MNRKRNQRNKTSKVGCAFKCNAKEFGLRNNKRGGMEDFP